MRRSFILPSIVFVAMPVFAQAQAALEVKVSETGAGPLPGATVVVVGQRRECATDAAGVCAFEGLQPGRYDVSVRLAGYTGARAEATVKAGEMASLPFALTTSVHFSESVTVSTGAVDTFEAFKPTNVIGGEELTQRISTNLGDTLASQAGVNVRAFGPGPSRPVVRGFDGDRVLVLENGARTGDLSSQSGDHGVTVDTAGAAQIEVVRGAATLLYGSNALGGVVNLISDEIPTKPVKGAHGALNLSGGSANTEAAGSGNLSFGNERWAFRVGGAGSRTGDVDTPTGTLPNSQSDLTSGGAAFSRTGDRGYLGASYAYVDSHYGIPLVEEGETTLHPRRHKLDVRGERRGMEGFIEGLKFVGGYRNYKHDEIEGDGTIATSFRNEFTEGQLLLNHRATGRLKGTFGFWGTHRDYSTAGAEALAPPVKQNSQAAFFYEELTYHHVGVQFGARLDRTSFDTEPTPPGNREMPSRIDRDFTEFSGSLGLLGFLNDDVTLALNFSRAARNPSLEELYNFGPHPGNFAFEIGNSGLAPERGVGADLSLRFRKPRFSGEVTVFSNWIDNFIFPLQTGEARDEFTVIKYTARNALLRGFEAHVDVGLTEKLSLELGGDGVHGEVRNSADPSPRIPLPIGRSRGGCQCRLRVPADRSQGDRRRRRGRHAGRARQGPAGGEEGPHHDRRLGSRGRPGRGGARAALAEAVGRGRAVRWVLFSIGPGGKTGPARFAKIPVTYRARKFMLMAWKIASPTAEKPVFTFGGWNGGGTSIGCHGAAANAAAGLIDKFIEDNAATLSGK